MCKSVFLSPSLEALPRPAGPLLITDVVSRQKGGGPSLPRGRPPPPRSAFRQHATGPRMLSHGRERDKVGDVREPLRLGLDQVHMKAGAVLADNADSEPAIGGVKIQAGPQRARKELD